MISWLNFEELLIHNPIELINPSNDIISVAMNKKQYIDFFSNKYAYNGLYYDEEMDFCIFYYADPLQSSKQGDIYAQEYIDVDMKIYRVKWLCNISLVRVNDILQGVQENKQMKWSNINFLCKEFGNFTLSEKSLVRYGSDNRWLYKELQAGTYTAGNDFFGGDPISGVEKKVELVKWSVKKTEMRVTPSTKSIVMIQSGALIKCTTDRNITAWKNQKPNANYKYLQPQYSLNVGVDDFIISGYGMRGLKNG